MPCRSLRVLSKLLFCLLVLTVGACAEFQAIGSKSVEYRSFVDSRVEEAKIFDRGKELMALKVMPAGQVLMEKQREVTPGFSFPLDQYQKQVVVAVDMTGWDRFLAHDLKYYLNEVGSSKIREISSEAEIQEHYPFAYPHYRVFVVSFPQLVRHPAQSDEWNLKIQSIRGQVEMKLKGGIKAP